MCSYNKVNDVYSCENNGTLNNDLRNSLGFTGFVMSDWNATHEKSQPGHLMD
jgi:beta-glucosidase